MPPSLFTTRVIEFCTTRTVVLLILIISSTPAFVNGLPNRLAAHAPVESEHLYAFILPLQAGLVETIVVHLPLASQPDALSREVIFQTGRSSTRGSVFNLSAAKANKPAQRPTEPRTGRGNNTHSRRRYGSSIRTPAQKECFINRIFGKTAFHSS